MTALSRRRFLTIAAAALACPARAADPAVWTGRALGADARIVLLGADGHKARPLFARIEAELSRVESYFSLHTDSALFRLNRDGWLGHPAPAINELFELSGRIHNATGGIFDPSIQPLWRAVAAGGDAEAASKAIDWNRVRQAADEIRLEPGMALTFNGIAQGFAADRIAALLKSERFGNVLVDIGEVMALGRNGDRAWLAAIADPDGREIARTDLTDRALATSSPMGTRIGNGTAHILHPKEHSARWSTVSVSAPEAAVADGLSTAFCLMERDGIEQALEHFPGARVEALV